MSSKSNHKLPKSIGAYADSRLEGVPLFFTADTGAARTVVSKRVFDQIPTELQPKLCKSASLSGAGGNILQEYGKAIFKIQLGPLVMQKEIIIAEIEDEGLLGADFLQEDESGPGSVTK